MRGYRRRWWELIFWAVALSLFVNVLPYDGASASRREASLNPAQVPPIGQIFTPAEYTGKTMDSGDFDCLAASVAMVLQGLAKEGWLTPPMSDADRYATVRKLLRNLQPDATSGLASDLALQVIPSLTNNQMVATLDTNLTADTWLPFLEQQLDAGYPVIADIAEWHLLAAGWPGTHAHSIVITGIQNGQVLYNDPWNQKQSARQRSMSTAAFATAWGNRGPTGKGPPFVVTAINRQGASLPPIAVTVSTPVPPTPTSVAPPAPIATAVSSPTPKPVAKPGGLWQTTSIEATQATTIIHLSAHAYPTHASDPPIYHVNFILWWPQIGAETGPWALACTAKPPPTGDVFACDADLTKLGVAPGQFSISFDVYDVAGNENLAPNGERSVTYQPQVRASFYVDATRSIPGLDTGVDLTAGQQVSISASGRAGYGQEGATLACLGAPETDANGIRYLNGRSCAPKIDPGAALPSAPVGDLIGRIGDGQWFVVSSNYSANSPASGRLYLLYNDTIWTDNHGGYDVTVLLGGTGASPPLATRSLPSFHAVDWEQVLLHDLNLVARPESLQCGVLLRPSVQYKPDASLQGFADVDRVVYGDIAGDGGEEAIITVLDACTDHVGSVLIYSMGTSGPTMVAALPGSGLNPHVANHELQLTKLVYKPGDSNCCPSGGTLTAQYQLRGGNLVVVSAQAGQ